MAHHFHHQKKKVRFFSPRSSKSLSKPYHLKKVKSDSAIQFNQNDTLSSLRKYALPLSVFCDDKALIPTHDQHNMLFNFLTEALLLLDQEIPNILNEKTLELMIEFVFLTDPNMALKQTVVNDSTAIWNTILELISVVNQPPKDTIKSQLKQVFSKFTPLLVEFNKSYESYKKETIKGLIQFYLKLEREALAQVNHPDTINDQIALGITVFQKSVKAQISHLDRQALGDLDRQCQSLKDNWLNLKWEHITACERFRDLYLNYIQTNRMLFPELSMETFNFDSLLSVSLDTTDGLNSIMATLVGVIFESLPNSIADGHKESFKAIHLADESSQETIINLVNDIYDSLCRYIKENAPVIDFKPDQDQLQLLSTNTPESLLPTLKFIVFYCEALSQYQFKRFLEYNPNHLHDMAVKLEREFFSEHPIIDTENSLMEFIDSNADGRAYYPSFGRYYLADEIINAVTSENRVNKKTLPEILRWDTTRLNQINMSIQNSMVTLVFIYTTEYFLNSTKTKLPLNWQINIQNHLTLSEKINWVKQQANLSSSDARVYERTIYSNASPSSKVFQTTLNKTKSQLIIDTLHDRKQFKYHSLFSKDLESIRVLINYLVEVHQPVFDACHTDFIQRKFMWFLQPSVKEPDILSPMHCIQSDLDKLKNDCKKIAQAMTAMLVIRQQFNSQFMYFGSDETINHAFSSISDRLEPFFNKHLDIRSNNGETYQAFSEELTKLSTQFYKDLNKFHWEIMKSHMLTHLQLPSFPAINDTHPILLNMWDNLESLHNHIQSLPITKKEEVIKFFKLNDRFPDSTDVFRQANYDISELYSKESGPVINFNHRQFSIPFKLCWSDLMTLCIDALKPTSDTDSSPFDIGVSTKLILKNKITQLVNKVLSYSKDNDQFKALPRQMRTGFDV